MFILLCFCQAIGSYFGVYFRTLYMNVYNKSICMVLYLKVDVCLQTIAPAKQKSCAKADCIMVEALIILIVPGFRFGTSWGLYPFVIALTISRVPELLLLNHKGFLFRIIYCINKVTGHPDPSDCISNNQTWYVKISLYPEARHFRRVFLLYSFHRKTVLQALNALVHLLLPLHSPTP